MVHHLQNTLITTRKYGKDIFLTNFFKQFIKKVKASRYTFKSKLLFTNFKKDIKLRILFHINKYM